MLGSIRLMSQTTDQCRASHIHFPVPPPAIAPGHKGDAAWTRPKQVYARVALLEDLTGTQLYLYPIHGKITNHSSHLTSARFWGPQLADIDALGAEFVGITGYKTSYQDVETRNCTYYPASTNICASIGPSCARRNKYGGVTELFGNIIIYDRVRMGPSTYQMDSRFLVLDSVQKLATCMAW